jgi:hypothetical protein
MYHVCLMLKFCCLCNQKKKQDAFFPRHRSLLSKAPCASCLEKRAEHLRNDTAARDAANKSQRDRYRSLRIEILAAYGGQCLCCGEKEFDFLCIDHLEDDGARHRKQIKTNIYVWLKKAGCPKDGRFGVSCHNCNVARGTRGYCPHKGRPSTRPVMRRQATALEHVEQQIEDAA